MQELTVNKDMSIANLSFIENIPDTFHSLWIMLLVEKAVVTMDQKSPGKKTALYLTKWGVLNKLRLTKTAVKLSSLLPRPVLLQLSRPPSASGAVKGREQGRLSKEQSKTLCST